MKPRLITLAALLALSCSSCRAAPKETPPPSIAPSPAPSASTSSSAGDVTAIDSALPPTPEEMTRLREHVIRTLSSATPLDPGRSPELFAASMTGAVSCDKQRCRAGREVCVVSSSKDYVAHCEAIDSWVDHRTPRPKRGFPPLGGITACGGSHNCPAGTVCCLHEIGAAEVQAVVCHADLAECRDQRELCDGSPGDCRTPGTKCSDYRCAAK